MKKLWLILLSFAILSLLSAPYALIAYMCYLGLCGGNPARLIAQHYTTFYGYFMWIYPLMTSLALLLALSLKKTHLRLSTIFLLIPVICFLPLVYVEWKSHQIASQYQHEKNSPNIVRPTDYSCTPGKFIRPHYHHNYYFYDYDMAGEYGQVTAYDNLETLRIELNKHSINLDNCKNQAGQTL